MTRWQEARLLKPSVIKAAITTLDHRLVIKRLGQLTDEDRTRLAALLDTLLGA